MITFKITLQKYVIRCPYGPGPFGGGVLGPLTGGLEPLPDGLKPKPKTQALPGGLKPKP